MEKTDLGILAIILGGILLSLELYGLKIINLLEIASRYAIRTSPFYYLEGEPVIILAVLIPLIIIVFGIILITWDKHFKASK